MKVFWFTPARTTSPTGSTFIATNFATGRREYRFTAFREIASLPNLKRSSIKDRVAVNVPLPPLPEQHEIVRHLDALFALADTIGAEVATAHAKTETLRQSILTLAFSGRLVPTEAELARREGHGYEPASTLLERIRSEKKEKRGGQSTLG